MPKVTKQDLVNSIEGIAEWCDIVSKVLDKMDKSDVESAIEKYESGPGPSMPRHRVQC